MSSGDDFAVSFPALAPPVLARYFQTSRLYSREKERVGFGVEGLAAAHALGACVGYPYKCTVAKVREWTESIPALISEWICNGVGSLQLIPTSLAPKNDFFRPHHAAHALGGCGVFHY